MVSHIEEPIHHQSIPTQIESEQLAPIINVEDHHHHQHPIQSESLQQQTGTVVLVADNSITEHQLQQPQQQQSQLQTNDFVMIIDATKEALHNGIIS